MHNLIPFFENCMQVVLHLRPFVWWLFEITTVLYRDYNLSLKLQLLQHLYGHMMKIQVLGNLPTQMTSHRMRQLLLPTYLPPIPPCWVSEALGLLPTLEHLGLLTSSKDCLSERVLS